MKPNSLGRFVAAARRPQRACLRNQKLFAPLQEARSLHLWNPPQFENEPVVSKDFATGVQDRSDEISTHVENIRQGLP